MHAAVVEKFGKPLVFQCSDGNCDGALVLMLPAVENGSRANAFSDRMDYPIDKELRQIDKLEHVLVEKELQSPMQGSHSLSATSEAMWLSPHCSAPASSAGVLS
jgi:hypothetical protein